MTMLRIRGTARAASPHIWRRLSPATTGNPMAVFLSSWIGLPMPQSFDRPPFARHWSSVSGISRFRLIRRPPVFPHPCDKSTENGCLIFVGKPLDELFELRGLKEGERQAHLANGALLAFQMKALQVVAVELPNLRNAQRCVNWFARYRAMRNVNCPQINLDV
jgi:hypothetical protein